MKFPRIVVGNLGVGSEEWTVDIYGPGTVRSVVREPIQWCYPRDDVGREQQCHDAGWLISQISALPAIAGEGGVVVVTVPGADLVLLDSQKRALCPVQHYRSVMPEEGELGLHEKALAGKFNGGNPMSPAYLYSATNGAITAPFQPPFQLLAYRERWPESFGDARQIVTLADWITLQLTGQLGADLYMAQSQGVGFREGASFECIKSAWEFMGLPQGTLEKMTRTRSYPSNMAMGGVGGTFVMPATHDSIWARRLAFETSPWIIWTGGWVGWTRQIGEGQYIPNDLLMEAGAAFEGIDHASALIGNLGMYGPIYKELVRQRVGGDYRAMSQAICRVRASGVGASVAPLYLMTLQGKPEVVVPQLVETYGGHGELAGYVFLRAVARECVDGLDRVARLLKLETPSTAAMTGNWFQNDAFLHLLSDFNLEVLNTPGAFDATNLGAAAEALRRYSITIGNEISFSKALALLTD